MQRCGRTTADAVKTYSPAATARPYHHQRAGAVQMAEVSPARNMICEEPGGACGGGRAAKFSARPHAEGGRGGRGRARLVGNEEWDHAHARLAPAEGRHRHEEEDEDRAARWSRERMRTRVRTGAARTRGRGAPRGHPSARALPVQVFTVGQLRLCPLSVWDCEIHHVRHPADEDDPDRLCRQDTALWLTQRTRAPPP